ncbi:MAG: peptidoglycan DD-metalloendopeptidase family protein [Flavobacteriales bacterium]|nr:peptidoglycan DD-metalloendopeptidase family protein [Flavobacteriales bacterium]
MRKFLLIAVLFLLNSSSIAQVPCLLPIDTVETANGTMLIYPNRTWAFLGEDEFDGVMNDAIHEMVSSDSTYGFKTKWDHNSTITCTTNEVNEIEDTLWLCVLDTAHMGFAIPFKGRMTSKYGYRRGRNHNGVDIDLETGDTIYAAFDGKVRYSQFHHKGFGNLIIIRHYNGLETYYGHASKLLAAPNQEVKAGDPIALGGNTGRSTGSHLHFEVRFYDNPINPELIFDFKQEDVKDNLLVHRGIFRPGSSATVYHSGSYDKSSSSHKIRSGDTLGKIARMYGTSVSSLCRLNGMKETDILHIGQVLRVR